MKYLFQPLILFLCSYHCMSQVSLINSKRVNNTLYDVLDINTGQIFSFSKVEKYIDSKPIDLSMCDDVIYIKYNNEYFKRNYEGPLNIKWFGCNESISDNQVIINKILAKYKKAYIPEGEYQCSGTIVVPEKSSLLGSGNTAVLKLVSTKPTNGIILSRWGLLKGFKLDCTATNMDVSAAILVNAWHDVESNLGELGIHDIVITGNYPQLQGVAIKLAIQPEKDKTYSVINFCKFSNIDIYGFRDGIFCSLGYEKGKNISYINANIFENIIIHRCLRPMRLINTADEADVVSGKSTIAFNNFENIIIQHVVGDYPAIVADGASYNKIDAQIIDWIGNYLENSRKSKFNVLNSLLGEPDKIKNY